MRAPELEDHTNVRRKRIRVLSIYFYYIHIHTSPHFSDYPNYHQKNRRWYLMWGRFTTRTGKVRRLAFEKIFPFWAVTYTVMSTEESFMDQQTQMVGGIFDDQAETQAADRSPVKQVVKTPVQYHFELASPGFGPQNENKQRVNDHTLNTDKDATKVKSHHGTLIPLARRA